MREGLGVGTFLLGLGIGAAAGIAVNRWIDQNMDMQSNERGDHDSPLDRQQIAQFAEQILQTDQSTANNV